MASPHSFRPDERLKTKYVWYVWLIFLVFLFPWVFLGFIPGAGWLYVILYLGANAIWIAIALALIPPYVRTIAYELGEEEILVRKGLWTRTVKVVPYRMVTNVEVKRGPLDRWLGLGTIDVHTAGYSQQTGAEAKLVGLADYEAVERAIYAALRRYRAGAGAAEAPPAAAPAEDQATLRAILDELRAIRQLLEQGRSR